MKAPAVSAINEDINPGLPETSVRSVEKKSTWIDLITIVFIAIGAFGFFGGLLSYLTNNIPSMGVLAVIGAISMASGFYGRRRASLSRTVLVIASVLNCAVWSWDVFFTISSLAKEPAVTQGEAEGVYLIPAAFALFSLYSFVVILRPQSKSYFVTSNRDSHD